MIVLASTSISLAPKLPLPLLPLPLWSPPHAPASPSKNCPFPIHSETPQFHFSQSRRWSLISIAYEVRAGSLEEGEGLKEGAAVWGEESWREDTSDIDSNFVAVVGRVHAAAAASPHSWCLCARGHFSCFWRWEWVLACECGDGVPCGRQQGCSPNYLSVWVRAYIWSYHTNGVMRLI